MSDPRQELLEAALERAAGQLGDVTAPIMAAFLARYPDAEDSFRRHQPDNPARLQAEMVGNTMYFVMTWFERRSEIEITVDTSVDHHHHTLKVPAEWYAGMVEAAIDVLAATAPPEAEVETAMWRDLRRELSALIRGAVRA